MLFMTFSITIFVSIATVFIITVFIITSAFLWAKLEIQIEGKRGWAQDLPTWRVEKHYLLSLFYGGRPLTVLVSVRNGVRPQAFGNCGRLLVTPHS